ncbi:zinc-ribbon domain-containing protein [Anaerovoracaceae bacterium 42-11]
MFCHKCGTELPDNAKFCYKCGSETIDISSEKKVDNRDNTKNEIIIRLENSNCVEQSVDGNSVLEGLKQLKRDYFDFIQNMQSKMHNPLKVLFHPVKEDCIIVHDINHEFTQNHCIFLDFILVSLDNKKWYLPYQIWDLLLEEGIDFYFMFIDGSKVYHYSEKDYYNLDEFLDLSFDCFDFANLSSKHWIPISDFKDMPILFEASELEYTSNREDSYNIIDKATDILHNELTADVEMVGPSEVPEHMLSFFDRILQSVNRENNSMVFPINNLYLIKVNTGNQGDQFITLGNICFASTDGKNWTYYTMESVSEANSHGKHLFVAPFDFSFQFDMSLLDLEDKKILRNFLNIEIPFRIEKMDAISDKEQIIEIDGIKVLHDENRGEVISDKFYPNDLKKNMRYFGNMPVWVSPAFVAWRKLEGKFEELCNHYTKKYTKEISSVADPFEYMVNTVTEYVDLLFKEAVKIAPSYLLFSVDALKNLKCNKEAILNCFDFVNDAAEDYMDIYEKVMEMQGMHAVDHALRPRLELGGIGLGGILAGGIISSAVNGTTSAISNAKAKSKVKRYIDDRFANFRNKKNVNVVTNALYYFQKILYDNIGDEMHLTTDSGQTICQIIEEFMSNLHLSNKTKFALMAIQFSRNNKEVELLNKIKKMGKCYELITLIFLNEVGIWSGLQDLLKRIEAEFASTMENGDYNSLHILFESWSETYSILQNRLPESYNVFFTTKLEEAELKTENLRFSELARKDINEINSSLLKIYSDWQDKNNFTNFDAMCMKSESAKEISKLIENCDLSDKAEELIYIKALFYCYGFGTEVNYFKAKSCFTKLKLEPYKGLGLYHLAFIEKSENNIDGYWDYLVRAAEENCIIAYAKIGEEYRHGNCVKLSIREIDANRAAALEGDNRIASVNLANKLYHDDANTPNEYTFELIKKVIEKHTPNDGVNLVYCYKSLARMYAPLSSKEKVKCDFKEAKYWYNMAIKEGDLEAKKELESIITAERIEEHERKEAEKRAERERKEAEERAERERKEAEEQAERERKEAENLRLRTVGDVVYDTVEEAKTVRKEKEREDRECKKIKSAFAKAYSIETEYLTYMKLFKQDFTTQKAADLLEEERVKINQKYQGLQKKDKGRSVIGRLLLAIVVSVVALGLFFSVNLILKIVLAGVTIYAWGRFKERVNENSEVKRRNKKKKDTLSNLEKTVNVKNKEYLISEEYKYKKKQ